MPTKGFHTVADMTLGEIAVHGDVLTDAFGNRSIDATVTYKGNTRHAQYVFIDGLEYQKNDNYWTFATIPKMLQILLLPMGVMTPAATFSTVGHAMSVSSQGSAPCGESTCDLFLASRATKLGETPMANVWHLSVDRKTHYLVSADSAFIDASGKTSVDYRSTFDRFDGVKVGYPAVTLPGKNTCNEGDSPAGHVKVCVNRALVDVYTVNVGDTEAIRAGAFKAEAGVSSPVVDGIALHCNTTKQPQPVDPKLADILKKSGMTDEFINAQLGQKTVASDCTVTSNGASIYTAHFDLSK